MKRSCRFTSKIQYTIEQYTFSFVFSSSNDSSVILLKGLSMWLNEGNIDQGKLSNEQAKHSVKN